MHVFLEGNPTELLSGKCAQAETFFQVKAGPCTLNDTPPASKAYTVEVAVHYRILWWHHKKSRRNRGLLYSPKAGLTGGWGINLLQKTKLDGKERMEEERPLIHTAFQ